MYHSPLRTTIPYTRINDNLVLDKSHHTILLRHQNKFLNQNHQPDKIPDFAHIIGDFNADYLGRSLVYVVTETVADYPYTYFTEKTWKAMVTGVPFMLVGSQYSIKKLQEFGFLTFEQWWDELYDSKPTAAERIFNIVKELKKLSKLSVDQRKQILGDMAPVLEHNKKHLKHFRLGDLETIRKIL